MNRVKYTEWIDSYLDGELDESGRKEFETALLSNQALASEYRLEKELNLALSDNDLMDFRAKCISAQEEVQLSASRLGQVIQFSRKYWYAVASFVLIALIVGGMFLVNPGGYSPEKLFKMYYKSGETMDFRSGNVSMAEALLAFGKSDFETANDLFDQILLKDSRNFAVIYYKGISNIELKDFPVAIQMFETIIMDKNNLYTEYADWYLGLCYLASDRADEAVKIFETISSTQGHLYADDASSILEKLSKNEKGKKFLNNLFFLILPF